MSSPLDAFDFDDGLPHVIDDDEEAEAEQHLLSPCGSHDTNDDGVLLYFLTDNLGRPPHSAVFGGAAPAAVVTPKDPSLDVADLFNEDIGEWPVDDTAPIISTPKVPDLAYNDVDIAPQSPKSRAKSKDKSRPRIKLSLKKTNRAKSAANAKQKVHRKIPSIKDDPKREKGGRSTSKYNGVSRVSRKTCRKYESKFRSVRMGSYLLETDAALAYDGAVRASGLASHFDKINFEDEGEYRMTREREVTDRRLHEGMVPLEEALAQISAKVDVAMEKILLKKEGSTGEN